MTARVPLTTTRDTGRPVCKCSVLALEFICMIAVGSVIAARRQAPTRKPPEALGPVHDHGGDRRDQPHAPTPEMPKFYIIAANRPLLGIRICCTPSGGYLRQRPDGSGGLTRTGCERASSTLRKHFDYPSTDNIAVQRILRSWSAALSKPGVWPGSVPAADFRVIPLGDQAAGFGHNHLRLIVSRLAAPRSGCSRYCCWTAIAGHKVYFRAEV
jgi:hypothetical protein